MATKKSNSANSNKPDSKLNPSDKTSNKETKESQKTVEEEDEDYEIDPELEDSIQDGKKDEKKNGNKERSTRVRPYKRRSFLQHFYIRKQPKRPVKKEPAEDETSEHVDDQKSSELSGFDVEFLEFSHVAGNIFAGATSSTLCTLVSHPLNHLRRLYQMDQVPKEQAVNINTFLNNKKNVYRSVLYRAKLLYIERGISGFYKDHGPSQVVSLFRTTALFWTFETLQPIFDKMDTLDDNNLLSNFAAGFLSGAAAGVAGHPSQRIALRLAASSKIRERFQMVRVGYTLFKTEGWCMFPHGLASTLLHISPLYGFKFMFYNIFCDHLLDQVEYDKRDEIPALSLFTAGAAAGLISNAITYPLDVMRQRLQADSLTRQRFKFDATCRRIGQCFSLVWQREGVLGFYRGIVPCLLSSTVSTAVQFSVYDKQQTSISLQSAGRVSNEYRSIPHAVQKIFAEEGMKGFWRGHSTAQFQGLLQGMAIFGTFEQVRRMLTSTELATHPNLCNFASGFVTGAVVVITLSPLEVINTHVIARSVDRKVPGIQVAYELYKEGGLRRFFLGGHAAILHVGSLIGCKFLFYNFICNITISLTDYESREAMPTSVLAAAGGAAGFASHIVTYPMDLLKRRLQVQRSDDKAIDSTGVGAKCVAFGQCLRLSVRNDGFLGLYKGIGPCLIKSFVSTAVQFSAYDKLKKWLDNYL